jgi:hypothetical protein
MVCESGNNRIFKKTKKEKMNNKVFSCNYLEWVNKNYRKLSKRKGGFWFKLGEFPLYTTSELYDIFYKITAKSRKNETNK